MSTETNDLAQKYDTVAYAAQSNALSHPRHLATVALLSGLAPPDIKTARVLEVGCSDGANILPMAASLPRAQFVGCDVSGRAIAAARAGAEALSLSNVSFLQQDLATLVDADETFDYIIAHGVYSWVPLAVRESLLELASRRLAPDGALFVSYNVYPGCHVREATWRVLRHHVETIADQRQQLDATRALARLLAEPGATQTETDALLRQEFAAVAARTDSALYHDDLGAPNDPVYFHEFAAHLARHNLGFLAEAQVSMITATGLSPHMQQYVAGMDRLMREQYLDFARMRRFRQSIVCRRDAIPVSAGKHAVDVSRMHVAASMTSLRAASEGKPPAVGTSANDIVVGEMLAWLTKEAPRVVPVKELAAREHARRPKDDQGQLSGLLVNAWQAGQVELYTDPPPLAPVAGGRPIASPVVRWQVHRKVSVTNLRHETLRIDDPSALALLPLLDGTRTRAQLIASMIPLLPAQERARAGERVASHLLQFALHGLLVA